MSKFRHIRIYLLVLLASLANVNTVAQTPLKNAEQFFFLSQNDSALKYLNLAKSIFLKNKSDSMVAVVKNRIARILINENMVDSARWLLKSNYAHILQKYGDQNDLMSVCIDLMGDCYMSISDAETAVKYYRHSLSLRNHLYPGGHVNLAYSYANIARYHSFKMNIDSAYYYANKSFTEFNFLTPVTPDFAYERILLEHAYSKKIFLAYQKANPLRELDPIRVLYKKAGKYVQQQYGEISRQMATIHRHLGNTYTDETLMPEKSVSIKEHLFKQANYHYDRSLSILSATDKKPSVMKSTLYYVKALVFEYCYLGDSLESISTLYDRAITELAPEYKSNDTISQNAIRTCQYKYDLMTIITSKAFCNYKFHNTTHNIYALKRAYSLLQQSIYLWNQIILDFESPYANRLIQIYNNRIFDTLIEIAWELYRIEKNNQYLDDIFNFSELSKTSLQQRLLIEAGFDNIPAARDVYAHPAKIQDRLSKNALYLNFHNNTFVSAVSRDTFIVKQLSHSIQPDQLLMEYKLAMIENDINKYQTIASAIYRSFLRPVLEACNFKGDELIVATDGIISNVSISGLITDTLENVKDFRELNYAVSKYKIRYVLSAQNLMNYYDNKASAIDSAVIFVPEFKNYTSLPFSTRLIEHIRTKIPSRVFSGIEASRNNFASHIPNFKLIHVATHAEGSSENPSKTRILFSDLETDSNSILIDSIFKMKIDAELAILSACETNAGFYEYGEGTMNFARAFIYAGTKSTITTQWRVDDRSTASILSEFYNQVFLQKSLSASLQVAQLHYLHNCKTSTEANPMYWSGLNLTGTDSNICLKSKFDFKFWISTAVFGMLLIVGIFGAVKYRYSIK